MKALPDGLTIDIVQRLPVAVVGAPRRSWVPTVS